MSSWVVNGYPIGFQDLTKIQRVSNSHPIDSQRISNVFAMHSNWFGKGNSIGFQCVSNTQPMDFQNIYYGWIMGIQLIPNGFSIYLLLLSNWYPRDFQMISNWFPRYAEGVPMDFQCILIYIQWFVHWFPMGFHWASNLLSIDIQWIWQKSNVFPIRCWDKIIYGWYDIIYCWDKQIR